MKSLTAVGLVVNIENGVARIEYISGGTVLIPLESMPQGVKVGDRVIVTWEVNLSDVKLAE